MSALLLTFVLIDGLVTHNPQPWAAPIRAGLVAALFICGMAMLWRAHAKIELGWAIIIGVLAAMTISDVYRSQAVIGLSSWLLYAGAYALQHIIKRDWKRDLVITGIALVGLCLIIDLTTAYGIQKPNAAWNKNVIGGILAVTLPAAMMLHGRGRIISSSIIGIGIILSNSRGAIVAGLIAAAVMIQPWALLVAPVAAFALIFIRVHDAALRLLYWQQGIQAFLSSPIFGVGQGNLVAAGDGVGGVAIHVHNTLLGILATVGCVGVGIVAISMATSKRINLNRWQLATLAAVAAHSMVDDPSLWWPVGIIVALVMASQNEV